MILETVVQYVKLKEKQKNKDAVLLNLDRKISELEAEKPDYRMIAEEITKALGEKGIPVKSYAGINTGNKVIGIGEYENADIDGLAGKVVDRCNDFIAVEWERSISGGGDCCGKARDGHGQWVPTSRLKGAGYDDELREGDEVIGIKDCSKKICGLKGKIVHADRSDDAGIEWEKNIGGHNCNGHAKDGYGWYTPKTHFRKINSSAPEIATKKEYQAFIDDMLKEACKETDYELNMGDEIIGIGEYQEKNIDGLKGKVVADPDLNNNYVSVEWERNIGGHDCSGRAKEGHGWNVPKNKVTKINTAEQSKETVLKIISETERRYVNGNYEQKIAELIKTNAFEMKEFGMKDRDIAEFFQQRLPEYNIEEIISKS